jgi:hypothetical protein
MSVYASIAIPLLDKIVLGRKKGRRLLLLSPLVQRLQRLRARARGAVAARAPAQAGTGALPTLHGRLQGACRGRLARADLSQSELGRGGIRRPARARRRRLYRLPRARGAGPDVRGAGRGGRSAAGEPALGAPARVESRALPIARCRPRGAPARRSRAGRGRRGRGSARAATTRARRAPWRTRAAGRPRFRSCFSDAAPCPRKLPPAARAQRSSLHALVLACARPYYLGL